MDSLVIRTLLFERIAEVVGQLLTLEQIVEQIGVVCSICMRQKQNSRYSAGTLTRHIVVAVVVVVGVGRVQWSSSVG